MMSNEELLKNFLQKLYDEKIIEKNEAIKIKKQLEILDIVGLSNELGINPDEYLMQICREINKYLKKYPKIKKSEVTEKNIMTLEKYKYNLIANLLDNYPEPFFLLQEIVGLPKNDSGKTIGARTPQR